MFKNGSDYDVDLQKLAASNTLKKINALPRDQKHWLDNIDRNGAKNPMYGKTHDTDARKKISVAHTGRKHNPEVDVSRKQTMMQRYGKKVLGKPTHTFAGVSIWDFLDNNSEKVFALVDETHKYKYHKVHAYILSNLTSDTKPSQNFRSVAVCKWFKQKLEETA